MACSWIDFALDQNPDTDIFIAIPWSNFPASSGAIYGVPTSTYDYDHGYRGDRKGSADAIIDGQDPAHNAPLA